ncbi:MAG: 23S rRNA (adenine(2503)-C(2))-methyltransferase [Chloroflexi bacterium RBG_13_52_12]|nr:MAG: 23S rRNA (adenine(2503)-C(2))-methyltransferase [Chloroflexi bacterium RBG_13_52_12]
MPFTPVSITELNCAQFDDLAVSMGEPSYRAKQVRKWVYQNLAFSYDEMTDLPLALRQRLIKETRLHSLEMVQQIAGSDGTVKSLFKCADGRTIEAALMYYGGEGSRERQTVCVSTQAGCGIGCPFCATGQQGFERNLTPGEIIDQVLYFARYLREEHEKNNGNTEKMSDRVSNIVFMGMGEPLANYEALWQAIETLNSPEYFGLGARNMVISTAGLVPQIQRLAREKLQVGLAVSLHASDNALRNKLVPVNRKYPLGVLIPACREYSRLTGRRLSFEYILFKGVNDSIAQARELANLIYGLKSHVNLIPANNTGNIAFRSPPKRVVLAFENELEKCHVKVTLRAARGQDIDAGCGQLRSRFLKGTGKKPKNTTRLETATNVK